MQFSVIIPLFNKAPHVEGTIRSVLAQSHAPFEIIVVDDGSTDGGLEIVRAIEDPRIRTFTRSPPGPGGYAARNLAIEQAVGEWIAFIDADDVWMPDHLAGLVQAFTDSGGTAGCLFSRLVSVKNDVEHEYPVSDQYLKPGQVHDFATMLRAWLDKGRCPLWTGALAFRRQIVIDAGLFPAGRARRGGDKDLWLRCMALAGTAYNPAVTAHFHQDTVNRVSNNAAHAVLPIITSTIAELLAKASAEEKPLLRQLHNQEIGLYAKYATGAGTRLGWNFPRSIYLPEGAPVLARVLAMMALRPLLSRSRR